MCPHQTTAILAELLEDAAHALMHVRPIERKSDIGIEKARAIAAIIAPSAEAHAMEGDTGDCVGHCVRELNFAPRSRLRTRELTENLRLENVTADNGQGRRGVG